MQILLHFCFVVCALSPIAFGYRILGVFPIPSKSHYYVGQALMQGLVERGHEVTVISPFKVKHKIKNYSEVFIENSYDLFRKCEFQSKKTVDNNFIFPNFFEFVFNFSRVQMRPRTISLITIN